jgi:UDP-glucuronate 4-epimerase
MPILREILVTGGSGFIGSHLVDRLLAEQVWRVTVYDNFDDTYPAQVKLSNIRRHQNDPRFNLIRADILDTDRLENYFQNSKPECVVHLAARTGVRQSLGRSVPYLDTNVRGTLKLLEIIRKYSVESFVYGSSSAVYGARDNFPFSEDDALLPVSPYGMSKAAAELVCHTYSQLYCLRCVCLRIFSTYGERQRPDLAIHKFSKLIVNGEPIPAYGIGKVRDYTYIDDIVSGICLAIGYSASQFETINLGGSEPVELSDLIAALEQKLETKAIIHRLPLEPGDQPHSVADITKARRLLGYEPKTTIDEGLDRFIDWFKESQISNLRDIERFRRARKVGSA